MKLTVKNLLIFVPFVWAISAWASEKEEIIIQMPDKKNLIQQFGDMGLQHFNEKTDVVEKLAGEQLNPIQFIMTLDCALSDYTKKMTDESLKFAIRKKRGVIIEKLLVKHPKALEELKQYGYYKPQK